MTQSTFDIQDIARLYGTFTDIDGNPVDPSDVKLWVKTPDGNVSDFEYPEDIQKSSTGAFYYDFSITQVGIHYYRYEGTGAAQAGGERTFTVKPSQIITG